MMRLTLSQRRCLFLIFCFVCFFNHHRNSLAQNQNHRCNEALISISVEQEPLSFSTIMPCGGGGVATLNPGTGAYTASGCIDISSAIPSVARVRVVPGQTPPAPQKPVRVSVHGNVAIHSGGNSMNVGSFYFSGCEGGGNCTEDIITQTKTYNVGASLSVGANQPVGKYSGSFTVVAECQ